MVEFLTFLITLQSDRVPTGTCEVALKIHRDNLPGFHTWPRHGGNTTSQLKKLVEFLPDMYADMQPMKYRFIFTTVTVGPTKEKKDELVSTNVDQSGRKETSDAN